MVCRENKIRSAYMGFVKAKQTATGRSFNDAEVQSFIHQMKHAGDALDSEAPMTKDELVQMARHVRSLVEADPNIPDAEKYRESTASGRGARHGIVTRIDQEIKRLETGKNEKGEELTAAQKNTASHLYAIMHMQQMMEQVEPAKEKFIETNARHRGLSYQEARAEWDELMKESPLEHKSQVRDDVRRNLELAGVDAQTQLNLGVSGRAINAIEVMEARRQAHIATLESRSGYDQEHSVARFSSQDSGDSKLKCVGDGGCGQFGHERANCPNQKLVHDRDQARIRLARFNANLDTYFRASDAKGLSDHDLMDKYNLPEGTNFDAWRSEQQAALDAQIAKDPQGLKRNLAGRGAAKRAVAKAQRELDNQQAVSHPDVEEVFYNADSGLLVISQHGDDKPGIIRRANPTEADSFVERLRDGDSLSSSLNATVNNAHNHFANREDMQAALTQQRCPSCGEFASMNTSHTCPVSGGPSEVDHNEQLRRRKEIAAARRKRLSAIDPTNPNAQRSLDLHMVTNTVSTASYRDSDKVMMADGSTRVIRRKRHGNPKSVARVVDNGGLATSPVSYTFSDSAEVTGNMSVWKESVRDTNGQWHDRTVVSVFNTGSDGSGLKCTCADYRANYRCEHVAAVARTVGRNAYGADVFAGPNVVPGEPLNAGNSRSPQGPRVAPDMLLLDETNTDADALIAKRRATIANNVDRFRKFRRNPEGGHPDLTVVYQPTTDAEGNPTEAPDVWTIQETDDDGNPRRKASQNKTVDLNKLSSVTTALRQSLDKTAVRDRFGETMLDENGNRMEAGVRANVRARKGGITLLLERKYEDAAPSVQHAVRKAITDRLGLPVEAFTSKGLFVPTSKGAMAEMLERAHGNANSRRWNGPQVVAQVTDEDIAAARRGEGRF